MNLDNLLKYLMWIAFFIMVLAGLYFTLKQIGIL